MDSLLIKCQGAAQKLRLLFWPSLIVAAVSTLVFGFYLFNGETENANAEQVALASGLWSALIALFVYTFEQVPEYQASASWWQRVKCRCKQVAYLLLAIVLVLVTLSLLFLSLRFWRI